jgi:ATP-dependent helicase HrpA
MGWKPGELSPDADKTYAPIHRALLTGLLGNLGLKAEDGSYTGARGIKFWVHPGSGVARKAGRWIMAAEITETTRLYARTVATLDPKWIEQLGEHLIKRHHAEPHWEKNRGEVVALERGTVYGLPVYVNRPVSYGRLDPEGARGMFIREALVAGDFETRAPFFAHNRRLVRQIEELEHKSRRPDVLVDDELIFAFYDSLVPPEVHSAAGFEAWRRDAEAKEPKLLFLKREDLMRHEAAGITTEQFPPALEMAGRSFALEYHHEPGSSRDGVTMTVPLVALNQVDAAMVDWLVPGLRREKIMQLARSLPQRMRHRLGPPAEFSELLLSSETPGERPLAEAIVQYARRELGLAIPSDAFRPDSVPAHLSMNFRVVDEHGRQLAMGRNLAQLRAELGRQAQQQFAQVAAADIAQSGLTDWSFGELEEVMEIRRGAQTLIGYPALVDEGASVNLEVLDSQEKAKALHHAGLRRLFMLQLKDQSKFIEKSVPQALAMQFVHLGDAAELREQLLVAAFDRAFMAEPWPRIRAEFERRRDEGRARVALIAQELSRLVGAILAESQALQKKLAAVSKAFPDAARDLQDWAGRLLHRRFISDTPFERLQHFPRYLKAATLRLEKLRADPARDRRAMAELNALAAQWQRELARQQKTGGADPQLEQFRWLLEELRVQLFAQELRTPVPVSSKRLQKMWAAMQR